MANHSVKRPLPLLPHPDHLRKQAKAMLAGRKATSPGTKLADVQRDLAVEYGYKDWTALQAEVTRRASGALGRQVRTRRLIARTAEASNSRHVAVEPVPAAMSGCSRRFVAFPNPDSEGRPFLFSAATLVAPLGFAVVVLAGMGVVLFALHKPRFSFRNGQPVVTVLTNVSRPPT